MDTKKCIVCNKILLDQIDFLVFWSTTYGGYRYRSVCTECHKAGKNTGKRGRPEGFKLSKKSIQAITKARSGSSQTEETKDKISQSILNWWDERLPVSDELLKIYKKYDKDGEITKFVEANREALDGDKTFYSERRLRGIENRSISLTGYEYLVGDGGANPEEYLLIKEEIKRKEILFRKFRKEM